MLKEGVKAPPFALESDAGKKVSLKDFAGAPTVVYFYPKDSTPGCTREAQAFSAATATLKRLGATVLGISKDSTKSHCSFRDKYALTIPLLSDPDLTVHKAFGAYGEKTMYGRKVMGTIRSTFVIGADGKIARVFANVKVDGHADAVLAVLTELAGGGTTKRPSDDTTKTPARMAAAAKTKRAAKSKTKSAR